MRVCDPNTPTGLFMRRANSLFKGLSLDDAKLGVERSLGLLAEDFKLRTLNRCTIDRYSDVPDTDEGGHANGGIENPKHSTSGCRMQF